MSFALALHALAAVVWVGGMVFALAAMRPALLEVLPPPQALACLLAAMRRFFALVWVAMPVLLASGFWMFHALGFARSGHHVHLMAVLGTLMAAIFAWLYFGVYPKLKAAAAAGDTTHAKPLAERLRKLVLLNAALGVLVVLIAAGGRYA